MIVRVLVALAALAAGPALARLAEDQTTAGAGTPLAGTADEACETCHMPKLTAGGSPMHPPSTESSATHHPK